MDLTLRFRPIVKIDGCDSVSHSPFTGSLRLVVEGSSNWRAHLNADLGLLSEFEDKAAAGSRPTDFLAGASQKSTVR